MLEVVAETEAPSLPYEELLAGAVCEEPQAERAERIKAAAAAQAELTAASERARNLELKFLYNSLLLSQVTPLSL